MDEGTRDLLSLILQGLGFLGALVSLVFVGWQIKLNTKAIEHNAFNSAASSLMELGKLFVDRHHLRKYFYEGVPVPTNPDECEEAEAVAIVMLDFMSDILIWTKNYPHLYPPEEWRKWIEDMFFFSPMLRKVFEQLNQERKKWYIDDLDTLYKAAKHRQQAVVVGKGSSATSSIQSQQASKGA